MPNAQLLQQLFELLADSPNFKNLELVQQDEIKKYYANATDQELVLAIDVVRTDTQTAKEQEQEREKKQAQAAKDMQAALKKVKAVEMNINQKAESQESAILSAEVLEQLNQISDDRK